MPNHNELLRINTALLALSQTNKALLQATDEKKLMQTVCDIIVKTKGYVLAWVGYASPGPEKWVIPIAQSGKEGEYLKKIKVSWAENQWGTGPTGTAIRTRQIQIVNDTSTDPKYAPWRSFGISHGFRGSLSIPLVLDDSVFGALMIYTQESHVFNDKEVNLLKELGSNIMYGIGVIRTQKKLAESKAELSYLLTQTLEVVIHALEKRDPYTAGHQRRVATLSNMIGQEMGLSSEKIKGITYAAMVHDIGKIYVPTQILNSPAVLTKLEMDFIRTHPDVGFEIIKDVHYPWPIADIILQHHERLDGSGYPKKLKGDEIILDTRIVTVADIVDAMMTFRPYRPAFTIEKTVSELELGRGTQYDKTVIDVCIRLLREKGYEKIVNTKIDLL